MLLKEFLKTEGRSRLTDLARHLKQTRQAVFRTLRRDLDNCTVGTVRKFAEASDYDLKIEVE